MRQLTTRCCLISPSSTAPWESCDDVTCVRTCVFVPALADAGRRGRRRGAVSPGKEQGCTFHCQETLADTGREKRPATLIETRAQLSNRISSFIEFSDVRFMSNHFLGLADLRSSSSAGDGDNEQTGAAAVSCQR